MLIDRFSPLSHFVSRPPTLMLRRCPICLFECPSAINWTTPHSRLVSVESRLVGPVEKPLQQSFCNLAREEQSMGGNGSDGFEQIAICVAFEKITSCTSLQCFFDHQLAFIHREDKDFGSR